MEMNFDESIIIERIFIVRGQKIMLDQDLACLYQIPTKRLNEQVKRNADRFPADFMFQLTEDEHIHLRSQFATSSGYEELSELAESLPEISKRKGGRRYLPYAFTEHGVLMLSSVLSGTVAIQVNIRIMRVYVKLRDMMSLHIELKDKLEILESKVSNTREDVVLVFEAVKNLMEPETTSEKTKLGYLRSDQERQ